MGRLRQAMLGLALSRAGDCLTTLSTDSSLPLSAVGTALDPFSGSTLVPFLQPRVPGTAGAAAVRDHVLRYFGTSLPDWTVAAAPAPNVTLVSPVLESFGVVGGLPIVNIVATKDPPTGSRPTTGGGKRRLVLAAHYDSKYGDPPDAHSHHQNLSHGFIGATDSAVSCALALHVASMVSPALDQRWSSLQEAGLDLSGERGLQVLLLDGEEAFGVWSESDKLHGSRALARDWETAGEDIDLFILLDLLGAKGPQVPSFFRETHWAYQRMAAAERRLRADGLLETTESFFPDADRDVDDGADWLGGQIEDDHTPFLERGVRVLHLIPLPYPDVWHTMDDDADHLEIQVINDWARVLAAFVGDWLSLQGYLETA